MLLILLVCNYRYMSFAPYSGQIATKCPLTTNQTSIMKKYVISVQLTTLSDLDSQQVVAKLYELLNTFEKTNVTQHSLYTWQDPYTGQPMSFNEDGTIETKKFDIKNVTISVL